MQVDCPHCLHQAIITSRNQLTPRVADLYCQCKNLPDCGASFVTMLAFKHILKPPIISTQSRELTEEIAGTTRFPCLCCQQAAVITSRNQLTLRVADLYCQCKDLTRCGASFVASLAYKHDLNPPIKSTQQLAASLLASLPDDQRKQLLQGDLFG